MYCCVNIYHELSGSSLQLLANNRAVVDGSSKGDHVQQARHTMQTAKLLVQGHHLLGLWRSIIALFSIQ